MEVDKKKIYHRFSDAHDGNKKNFSIHFVITPSYFLNLDWIQAITLTHDNKYILSASTDKTIRIFDIFQKVRIHTYQNLHNGIFFFSNLLKPKLAQFRRIGETHTIFCQKDSIICLKLSQDSQTIVTGSRDCSLGMTRNMLSSKKTIVSGNPFQNFQFSCNNFAKILDQDFSNSKEEGLIYKKMIVHRIIDLILKKEVQEACELIVAYPNLKLMPANINLFHICTMLESNDAHYIAKCIESGVKYFPDRNQKTPLQNLMTSAVKDPARINALLSESEQLFDPRTCPDQNLKYLSQSLPSILKMDNNNVALFMQTLIGTPNTKVLSYVPSFGKLRNFSRRLYITVDSLDPDAQEFKTLSPKINEGGGSQLMLRYFRVPINFHRRSNQFFEIIRTLHSLQCGEVFQTKAVKILIDYGWSVSRGYIFAVSILYSISMVLFTAYTIVVDKPAGLEITDAIFASILLLYEVIQCYACRRVYFTDFWNLIDASAAILRLLVHILVWNEVSESAIEWITSFALLFGYLKWISCFRLFKSTSNNNIFFYL